MNWGKPSPCITIYAYWHGLGPLYCLWSTNSFQTVFWQVWQIKWEPLVCGISHRGLTIFHYVLYLASTLPSVAKLTGICDNETMSNLPGFLFANVLWRMKSFARTRSLYWVVYNCGRNWILDSINSSQHLGRVQGTIHHAISHWITCSYKQANTN